MARLGEPMHDYDALVTDLEAVASVLRDSYNLRHSSAVCLAGASAVREFITEREVSDELAEALRGMWAEYRTGQRYREPVSSAPATAALSRYDAARKEV